jgi:hypothetical protein
MGLYFVKHRDNSNFTLIGINIVFSNIFFSLQYGAVDETARFP